MSETAKLTRGSIGGHLLTQTAPMVIGVAAIMSIGLVDAYFIGQLGPDPLAAIAFIFPITVAIASLGVGVMVGINSVVARALGEGDLVKASARANLGVVFAVGVGIILAIALNLFIDPLFRLMNAEEHILIPIRAYMRPFSFGFVLQLLIMGLNGVLRGQGEAKKTSLISICYAVANWILDPILITGAFGFAGFGIAGAAYASVAGWVVGAALALYLMRKTAIPVNLASIKGAPKVKPLAAIVRVAGPAAFSNAINPIGLAVLTAMVAAEGQAAVAGFGAAGRVQSFAVVPLLALSGSIGAIVGQNWGAREYERARRAILFAFAFCIGWGLLIAALLASSGEWFAQFFTDSGPVARQFALYLAIAAWGYAGYGLLIVGNGILNAVDRASLALLQSCVRVFIFMLPVAYLLRPAWGSKAIYTSELVANLAGGAIAAAAAWWVVTRKNTKATSQAADPTAA